MQYDKNIATTAFLIIQFFIARVFNHGQVESYKTNNKSFFHQQYLFQVKAARQIESNPRKIHAFNKEPKSFLLTAISIFNFPKTATRSKQIKKPKTKINTLRVFNT